MSNRRARINARARARASSTPSSDRPRPFDFTEINTNKLRLVTQLQSAFDTISPAPKPRRGKR